MTWVPLIWAPSPRTLTTRTPIRGGPGNNPVERARYRNRARIAPIAGRSHVKGSDADWRKYFSVDWGRRMAGRSGGSAGAGGAGDGILQTEFPTWQTLEPDTSDGH